MSGTKLGNLFPHEDYHAPSGYLDTGHIQYVLDLDVLYKSLDARGKDARSKVRDLVALFDKLRSMVDNTRTGIPTSVIRRMCESGKIDVVDLAILCLLGLIGEIESSVYLNEKVLCINVDSEFLMEKAMAEAIDKASEDVVQRLVGEIVTATTEIMNNAGLAADTEEVLFVSMPGRTQTGGCISAGA